MNKINDNLIKLAGNKIFEKIFKKKPKKKVKFIDNIKVISHKRTKDNKLKVRKYLLRWKKISKKKKERDNKFRNALNIIDKRQIIDQANDINKIMTINK